MPAFSPKRSAKVIQLPSREELGLGRTPYIPPLPKPLTEDWVNEKFRQVIDGEQARAELITAHQGWAESVAVRFLKRLHLDFGATDIEHLEEEARCIAGRALTDAADRFNPERGVEFTTFATDTIHGKTRHFLRDNAFFHALNRGDIRLLSEANKIKERLTAKRDGRPPELAEIAYGLAKEKYGGRDEPSGEEVGKVLAALLKIEKKSRILSLNENLLSDEQDEWGRGATLPEMLGSSDEGKHAESFQKLLVEKLLGVLNENERLIIELFYLKGLKQHQIARIMGCSQMNVSRHMTIALKKMRRHASRTLKIRSSADFLLPD